MKRHPVTSLCVSALALWGCFCLGADWGSQPGVEALTRGPLHEAFAQPIAMGDEDQLVIAQRPPNPIEEIPPEEKPEGDSVVWIAGYWQWDNELSDFIWVSGCWRAVPPGTAWVPGYWRQTNQGFEWVAGFWKNADTRRIVYQAPPPETLERGPTTHAPGDDWIWVPGCWVWQSSFFWQPGRYAWRPGFWLTARPDWVWVSAHYVYTPQGCVFVEGYWDYSLERRGTVFLPVHCLPEARLRVGFVFSPYLVFEVGFLTQNLFCSQERHHYYYGDYYGERYLSQGYRPWFEPSRRGRCYEPIFAHEQWRHREDRDWVQRQRSAYEYRRDHDDARPPRTYRGMEERSGRLPPGQRKREPLVARPLGDVIRDADSKVRYERVSPQRRVDDMSRGHRLGDYREERSQWETPADATRRPVGDRYGNAGNTHIVLPPTQGQMEPPVRVPADQTRTVAQPVERHEGGRGNEDRDSRAVVPPPQGRVIMPVPESAERTRSVPLPMERSERHGDSRTADRSTQPAGTSLPETRITVTPNQADSGGERQRTQSTERVQPHTVRVPTSPITVERRSRSEAATPPATPTLPRTDPDAVRTEGSGTSPSDDSRGRRGTGWERRNNR